MVTEETVGFFATYESVIAKAAIILAGLLFSALLIFAFIFPLVRKRKKSVSIQMHPDISEAINLDVPVYEKIAVALAFSEHDARLLASLHQRVNRKIAAKASTVRITLSNCRGCKNCTNSFPSHTPTKMSGIDHATCKN